MQTACGFEDTLDDMYRYMMAACGPDPDEAKIARYCDESLGHFDWLVARGVPFDPTFCAETSMAPDGHRRAGVLGRRGRLPVQRDRPPGAPRAPGQDQALDRMAAHAAPGRRRHRRRGRRLDSTPGWTAWWSTTAGWSACRRSASARRCSLRARRGVVLTAGGFIFNDDMLRQHCPPLVRGHLQGGDRGRRRAGHPHGPGHRGLGTQHVRRRGVAAHHAAAHADPRHPGQRRRASASSTRTPTWGGSASPRSTSRTARSISIVDEASYEVNWMGLAASWVCETPARARSPRSACRPARSRPRWRSTTATPRPGEDPLFHKGPQWVRPLRPAARRHRPAHRAGALRAVHPGRPRDHRRRRGARPGRRRRSPGCSRPGAPRPGCARFGYASGLSIGDSTMFGRFAGDERRPRATRPERKSRVRGQPIQGGVPEVRESSTKRAGITRRHR